MSTGSDARGAVTVRLTVSGRGSSRRFGWEVRARASRTRPERVLRTGWGYVSATAARRDGRGALADALAAREPCRR